MISWVFLACVSAGAPAVEQGAKMPSEADVAAKVARARGLSAAKVSATALPEPAAPGVTVYRVVARGDDPLYTGAVARGGEVLVDLEEARGALARAWASAGRPAPLHAAKALVVLMDGDEDRKLIATEERVSYVRRLGVEGVDLPVERSVDGSPAVAFWYSTGSNPASEVIAVFATVDRLELRSGRTHGGG